MEQKRPRNANGTFQPGQPTPVKAGRVKGQLNKLTKDIRQGAIDGFARHGSNGRGEGGFAGFCYYLAKRHPKAAAKIVEKLLPLQVNATGISGASIGAINIVSVPSGSYLSEADMKKFDPTLQLEPPLYPTEHIVEHTPEIARYTPPDQATTSSENNLNFENEFKEVIVDDNNEPMSEMDRLRQQAINEAEASGGVVVMRDPEVVRKLPKKPSWSID